MWNPFRFKGMIYPYLALDIEGSQDVMERKSDHMVVYLRSRREAVNYENPEYRREQAKELKALSRKWHLGL